MGSSPFWGRGTKGWEGFGLTEGVYPPNPADLCRLKGLYLPGKASVKALPTQDFTREKAPGRDGGTIIMQGYLPGPIDIELLMWKPEQYVIWQSVLKEIWRRPGKISAGFSDRGTEFDTAGQKKAAERALIAQGAKLAEERAIEIAHPMLQPYDINRVVITGISLPEPGPVPGSKVVNIKCMEFVPTPPKLVTTRTKGTAKKVPPPTDLYQFPNNGTGATPGSTDGGPRGNRPKPSGGDF
jgi:hypothetical protein